MGGHSVKVGIYKYKINPSPVHHVQFIKSGVLKWLLMSILVQMSASHLPLTPTPSPTVPTHQEFLKHCWGRYDNWLLNKAFLLAILPFERTEEKESKRERERERERKRREKERGWQRGDLKEEG